MKRKQSALSDFWRKKDTTEAPPARETAAPRVTAEQKPQKSRRLDPDDLSSSLPPTSQKDISSSLAPDRSVTNQAPPGFQPFRAKDIYVCPYVTIQKCHSAERSFNTYRSLCGHVASRHQEDCLPSTYDEDPLENGTSKIPCPRGCGEAFTSHQRVDHHAKKPSSCPMPKRENDCAWPQTTVLFCG
jgi:hypothetical protein